MVLRNDIEEVISRTKYYYESIRKGSALIFVDKINSIMLPMVKPLNQWQFPEELYKYLDQCIERLIFFWDNRRILKDDYIPSILPRFGIAEHISFLGGDAVFTEDASYPVPLISEWPDIEKLKMDEGNPWFRMTRFDG